MTVPFVGKSLKDVSVFCVFFKHFKIKIPYSEGLKSNAGQNFLLKKSENVYC